MQAGSVACVQSHATLIPTDVGTIMSTADQGTHNESTHTETQIFAKDYGLYYIAIRLHKHLHSG